MLSQSALVIRSASTATTLFGLISITIAEHQTRIRVGAGVLLQHQNFVLNFLGHAGEHFDHILVLLRACFEEGNTVCIGQGLALLGGDLAVAYIAFVAHKHSNYVFIRVHFDLLYPVFDIGESLSVVNGVGEDDALSAFILGL